MHMLYNSDTFCVTHMLANAPLGGDAGDTAAADTLEQVAPVMARHGFEIIDKRVGKEVYLDGSWAEMFQQQIAAWQLQTPTQEEVEVTLAGYAELAQNPVLIH